MNVFFFVNYPKIADKFSGKTSSRKNSEDADE